MPALRRDDLFYQPRRWHKPVAIGLPVMVLVIVLIKYISEV